MNYIKYKLWPTYLSSALWSLIDLILPARCPQTGDIVPSVGTLSPRAWAALQFIAAPHCACCGIPFPIHDTTETDHTNLLCGPCLATPPPYHKVRSVLVYDDASRSLILGFKHGDKTPSTLTFAPLLNSYGHEILSDADCLIPVPLHWRRLLSRRYNQSALLAHSLSKINNIPTWADALQRNRHTAPQGHKNARDRHANVKNVFSISPRYTTDIKGKNVVLMDDVFTTGATVEECTHTLLKSGARKVSVLTLARIVKAE